MIILLNGDAGPPSRAVMISKPPPLRMPARWKQSILQSA